MLSGLWSLVTYHKKKSAEALSFFVVIYPT